MTSDSEKNKTDEEQDDLDELIRRDILLDRKFSIAEAIGREGGNFLKGHSPIPKLDQIISLINVFIGNNLNDSSRVLMLNPLLTIVNYYMSLQGKWILNGGRLIMKDPIFRSPEMSLILMMNIRTQLLKECLKAC